MQYHAVFCYTSGDQQDIKFRMTFENNAEMQDYLACNPNQGVVYLGTCEDEAGAHVENQDLLAAMTIGSGRELLGVLDRSALYLMGLANSGDSLRAKTARELLERRIGTRLDIANMRRGLDLTVLDHFRRKG